MSLNPRKKVLPPSPLDPWLKALGDNNPFQLSRMGAKAYALRALAKKTGIEVTNAAIARVIGTTPSALQHADDVFADQKPRVYALLKLAQVSGLLDEMDTEARRHSRTAWLNLFPIIIKDGFYPWKPPTGYRRPTGGELTGQATRNIRLSEELASKVAEDPALEKMLRRFQLRRDSEVADKLRETVLLIHEGWLPLRAAREKQLSIKKTTLWALLKNPILYGMIAYRGHLYQARVDKPIISKEEYELLQRRLPPRGGKNLFGFIWDNKKRVPDPREAWMVKKLHEMRAYLSNPQISDWTGMSLGLVRRLVYNKRYRDLVGEETWKKAHSKQDY